MRRLDCLTLAAVVAAGLGLAAAPGWADTKKPAPPPPPPPHVAPPPQPRPQAQPIQRPAPQAMQARPPAAAQRPNPAMQQRPAGQAMQRPGANQAMQHPGQPARQGQQAQRPGQQAQQARPAEQHRQQAAAVHPQHPAPAAQNHPAAAAHPAEQRAGMPAAHAAALTANAPRPNARVRDPAAEHVVAAAHAHDFHTRDVRRFTAEERRHWSGGHWRHDWYSGRFGWWFEVDDVWYAYPAPIFPYPLEVAPIVVEDAVGPVVEDQQPAAAGAVIAVAPLPPLPRAAYHCGNPEGFFPLVEECNVDWVVVGAH